MVTGWDIQRGDHSSDIQHEPVQLPGDFNFGVFLFFVFCFLLSLLSLLFFNPGLFHNASEAPFSAPPARGQLFTAQPEWAPPPAPGAIG